METIEILKEYLVAAAYVQMKRMVTSQLDLKVFPFTSQEVYRGQVERNKNGERIVYLFYKPFSEDLIKQIQKVLRNNKSVFWINVYSYMSYEVDNRNRRFPLKLLYLCGLRTGAVPDVRLVKCATTTFASPTDATKGRSQSTTSLPTVSNERADSIENAYKNNVTSDKIVGHIVKVFGKETKSKAFNMSQEYSISRNRIIYTLWKNILKSLSFSSETEIFEKNLDEAVNEFEVALFSNS